LNTIWISLIAAGTVAGVYVIIRLGTISSDIEQMLDKRQ